MAMGFFLLLLLLLLLLIICPLAMFFMMRSIGGPRGGSNDMSGQRGPTRSASTHRLIHATPA
jgi:Protein of unknown function (DUF2933)